MQRQEVARFAGPGASGRAQTHEFWTGGSCLRACSKFPIANPRCLNPDPTYRRKEVPQKTGFAESQVPQRRTITKTCHLRTERVVFAKTRALLTSRLSPSQNHEDLKKARK
jgi:hypothetical protein